MLSWTEIFFADPEDFLRRTRTHGHRHEQQDFVPHAPAGPERHGHHPHRAGRLGHRRQWLGGGLGAAGRRRIGGRDPPRRRARHQLDRHRGGIRPGTFRGNRAPRAGADGAGRAALCVHQMRPDLVRGAAAGDAAAHRRAGQHPARSRGLAAPAGRGAYRSLPDALAGGRRHALGGVLAGTAGPEAGGQGQGGGAVQPQSGAVAAGRGAGPCGYAAAAVLGHPACGGRGSDSVVRAERDRGDRLQPDAIRPLDRQLQPGARQSSAGKARARI